MIEIKDIKKRYQSGENSVDALKGISLSFREAEFVSILGQSGCGKTTLLNIIGGLDKYSSGDIIIENISTKQYKDKDWDNYRNKYIGFVFQSYNLLPNLSILENVELSLSIAGKSKKERRALAKDALKMVGLDGQIKKKPNQLSGGQMQRVAIARAIINNPRIILADEPTGALDSETSEQVMQILKEISSKYLVVMVTHNSQLAEKYSTRIIQMLDGKVVSDSSPFDNNLQVEENTNNTQNIEKNDKKASNAAKKHQKTAKNRKINKKAQMNFLTAFMLSLKNLWSKKGKTIIEAFAGSIGIIGIALILAVSNGFSNYIDNLQANTLGGYPITISTIAMDYDVLKSGGIEEAMMSEDFSSETSFGVYDPSLAFSKLGHLNKLSDEFISYINAFKAENPESIKNISCNYNLPLNLLTKQPDGSVTFVASSSSTSAISGNITSSVYEILDEKEWILGSYDLIGSYMQNADEVMLVIGKDNKLSIEDVKNFGLPYSLKEDGVSYNAIEYANAIQNTEYALLLNNGFYTFDGSKFNAMVTSGEQVTTAFSGAVSLGDADDTSGAIKLKISGILVAKEDADIDILTSGIVYNKALREFYVNNSQKSDIYKYAAAKVLENQNNGLEGDLVYGIDFPWTFVVEVSELTSFSYPAFKFNSTTAMQAYIKFVLGKNVSLSYCYSLAMQAIGASATPFSISVYPASFDGKSAFKQCLEDWNATQGKDNKILCIDLTEFLTGSLGELIDIISYVLIAFAGISLIVSSVMIGIITYSSVIERTKEIGILRSVGARKKDISRIFISESFLIGLLSGICGVLVSFILTIPISAIIKAVAGGSITESLAVLKPLHAVLLVLISTILTTLSGLIPARIAAKKDPVKCLTNQ